LREYQHLHYAKNISNTVYSKVNCVYQEGEEEGGKEEDDDEEKNSIRTET
jgi:hypothetical protein